MPLFIIIIGRFVSRPIKRKSQFWVMTTPFCDYIQAKSKSLLHFYLIAFIQKTNLPTTTNYATHTKINHPRIQYTINTSHHKKIPRLFPPKRNQYQVNTVPHSYFMRQRKIFFERIYKYILHYLIIFAPKHSPPYICQSFHYQYYCTFFDAKKHQKL